LLNRFSVVNRPNPWVNNRLNSRIESRLALVTRRNEHVLSVPRLDPLIVPDTPAHFIATNEFSLVKKGLPISRPLAIHMMLAALVWAGCGEYDVISMSD
jgi:hypothetical protein